MTRCYLKRSAKTAIFIMIAFIMVFAMIDTRNRYNSYVMSIESDPFHSVATAVRRRDNLRLVLNKTDDASNQVIIGDNELDSQTGPTIDNEAMIGDGHLPSDNGSLTLRFWDLANNSSRGAKTRGIFTESNHLPYLWRPEKPHLSRDDDRVLAQLILAMEATNISLSGRLTKMKTIYLPDSFRWWSKTKWRSPHVLQDEDCPGNPGILRKCAFSQDRDSMDALITVRDAFHTRDFTVPSHVLRFYFMLESPIFSHANLKRSNDLMATFYRGSDVNTPYGKWVYHDPAIKFKTQEKDYAAGKSKMAAIFTSNCHPWNNRMGFVRELQKHISVDVYGSCGQMNCPRYNQRECYDMLKKDYRFYLSFENSNCRDYVTEKLFMNAYENDVIPIVLGAHPEDYKAMCPEKSYIHVEDFPNPVELAKYMKHLANTPDEYNSYFRWKDTGRFIDTNFFCRVCAMVHYADIIPPPERKTDFRWNSDAALTNKLCLPSGAWYWNASSKSS
ncbi:Glycoprotein 3-alpha-L-fucosyltransferase A [Orchesella cincta]|uniref:Fucosyltransferase n=1 Tax=Orchesella cincta TaxID=48709 RepID=A0A1D2MN21_ORCCI|nr:Glycoprotein 3-alpha-L-fucosyltransferase A [Orchesella cincta]